MTVGRSRESRGRHGDARPGPSAPGGHHAPGVEQAGHARRIRRSGPRHRRGRPERPVHADRPGRLPGRRGGHDQAGPPGRTGRNRVAGTRPVRLGRTGRADRTEQCEAGSGKPDGQTGQGRTGRVTGRGGAGPGRPGGRARRDRAEPAEQPDRPDLCGRCAWTGPGRSAPPGPAGPAWSVHARSGRVGPGERAGPGRRSRTRPTGRKLAGLARTGQNRAGPSRSGRVGWVVWGRVDRAGTSRDGNGHG